MYVSRMSAHSRAARVFRDDGVPRGMGRSEVARLWNWFSADSSIYRVCDEDQSPKRPPQSLEWLVRRPVATYSYRRPSTTPMLATHSREKHY